MVSWIAAGHGGEICGVIEALAVASGNFGVAEFVETHLVESSVVWS
jgi:hypothetical protein